MSPEFFDAPIQGVEMAENLAIGIMIFVLVFYLIAMVLSIVMYVLRSLGVYTIAKRRGIHHPWLAWLPIGDAWILGSISDQYQYVAKGKIRNRRKVLLGLYIALYALMTVMLIAEVSLVIAMEVSGVLSVTPVVLLLIATMIAIIVIGILYSVFFYMAQYDLYESCDPSNAVVYLVLGIFFQFLQPIFLFINRKKDLGMPPRKQAQPIVREIPQEQRIQEPAYTVEPKAVVPPETLEPAPAAEEPCIAEENNFPVEPTETE